MVAWSVLLDQKDVWRNGRDGELIPLDEMEPGYLANAARTLARFGQLESPLGEAVLWHLDGWDEIYARDLARGECSEWDLSRWPAWIPGYDGPISGRRRK